MMVHCSKGPREVLPGMQFRDTLSGSVWEVVEASGERMYSPSSLGGVMGFWCKPVKDQTPESESWLAYSRDDGCIEFCGDSVAAMLIAPDQKVTEGSPCVSGETALTVGAGTPDPSTQLAQQEGKAL